MKKFVELIQRAYQERYSVVINKILKEKIPVAFLSINPNAVSMVKNLRSQGLNITNCITVTPPRMPEMASELDFQITALDKISALHPIPEYVLTTNLTDARIAVKNFKKSKVLNIERGNQDYVYNMFMNHLQELQEVYESLIDEESRRTFYGYWLANISNQFAELVHANGSHYITQGFIPEKGSIVIDGGVCDGSTSAMFTDFGFKVYGFEMDKENFELAKKAADEKGFIVENLGLGSYKHEMKYMHAPDGHIGGSRLDIHGSETTQITTLDAYVSENNLPSVDFIKLDVEGAELDVLKGATNTIARFKPILMLSAYHKWDDFWVLMNFVKSVRNDYEFALRQYTVSHEDDKRFLNNVEEANFMSLLGLDAVVKPYNECCLLAR